MYKIHITLFLSDKSLQFGAVGPGRVGTPSWSSSFSMSSYDYPPPPPTPPPPPPPPPPTPPPSPPPSSLALSHELSLSLVNLRVLLFMLASRVSDDLQNCRRRDCAAACYVLRCPVTDRQTRSRYLNRPFRSGSGFQASGA